MPPERIDAEIGSIEAISCLNKVFLGLDCHTLALITAAKVDCFKYRQRKRVSAVLSEVGSSGVSAIDIGPRPSKRSAFSDWAMLSVGLLLISSFVITNFSGSGMDIVRDRIDRLNLQASAAALSDGIEIAAR